MLKYFDALELPVWVEWVGVIAMGIIFGCMFAFGI